jgi:GT2 family glycosyltransferase
MNFRQEINGDTLAKTIETVKRKPLLKDITLIVPTLGRFILEECLAKIISGSRWPRTLIIVHQGNEPSIKEWAKLVNKTGIETVYIHSAERGKPAAVNNAFAQTQTRFVCMIDDDCFVYPDWLENMHHCLKKTPNRIITGRVEPTGNETVAIVQLKDAVVYSRPRVQFDLFVGGNMGASMDIIRLVGPFDEDPLLRNAAEDVEWGYRALRKGIPIAYAPEVAVSHFGWRNEKENFDRFMAYAHGHGSFYGKYIRDGDLFILLRAMVHFARAFRRWVHGNLTGNTEYAMNGKAYCVGLLPGIIAGFRSKIRLGKLP